MKKRVSLFNDDFVEKKKFDEKVKTFIAMSYFEKFSDETLFYIFYYLTKDTLQLFAASQLYKNKWKYHVDYQIWYKDNNPEKEELLFFNPLEWKISPYVYGPIPKEAFLGVEEVEKYITQFQQENKK